MSTALMRDWWVRSKIIWHKPNPMPESTTDRPTSAYEEVFLLSKSGDKLFWTHRDFPGVRVKPEPDYVYRLWEKVNGLDGHRDLKKETPIEPPGWRDDDNWQRVNLWAGHDYFYDPEAVRVECLKQRRGRERLSAPGESTHTDRRHDAFVPGPAEQVSVGANLRNVWTIPTQSVTAAHFATFPEKLVEPCILAGTSAEGACAKCGAPWARVVKREDWRENGLRPKFTGTTRSDTGEDSEAICFVMGLLLGNEQQYYHRLEPTCECEAPTVPCTVLDPFVGSGTTLRVATRFNRSGIGCDMSYQEIAKERTIRVQRELHFG